MRSRTVLCLVCGWTGRRTEDLHRACAHCGDPDVVVAGDPIPIPRDPVKLVRTLDQDPWLLWRLLRELASLRLALPWTSDGQGYAERTELSTGHRVAWIQRSAVGGWTWQTLYGRGDCATSADALDQADQNLLDGDPTWRLVPTSRPKRSPEKVETPSP